MTSAYIMLSVMAVVLLGLAHRQNKISHGFKEAFKLFKSVIPLLLCAFIIVGYLNVLIPVEILQAWIGREAGWKGLFIGPAVGMLIQGGPYAFFTLYDAVFKEHISIGTAVAMITAWGMINVGHLPYELTFLGRRFVLLKYSIYLMLPTLAGLIAAVLFGF